MHDPELGEIAARILAFYIDGLDTRIWLGKLAFLNDRLDSLLFTFEERFDSSHSQCS